LDYFLTEQQKEIKNLTRTIAEEQVLPVRAELDEKEEFPWEIMKILADAGLFGVYIPEEYGGLGGGLLDLCLVVEELSRVCSGIAVSYAASGLGTFPLLEYGTDEQRKKYLPDIASGRKLAAFGLTEADAGSDPGGIKATAQKTDKGYIINGTKQFITNGGDAEVYTVIALTDKTKGPRGASAFIVEKDTPGFTFGRKYHQSGGDGLYPHHEAPGSLPPRFGRPGAGSGAGGSGGGYRLRQEAYPVRPPHLRPAGGTADAGGDGDEGGGGAGAGLFHLPDGGQRY